jgi:hypothetical protein
MRKRLNEWSNIWLGLAEENSRYCTAWNRGGALFHKNAVWWLSILFGLLSAVINLPIVEKPLPRLAAAAA